MAAAERWGAVKGPARGDWELMPLESVGPLCFGMRITEVAAVLPSMTELRRFQAAPLFPETLGVEFGMGREEPAVYSYFVDGRLFGVAVDTVHGPQVTLWGRELTACVPADLEQFLLHADGCGVLDVSYGPRGNPGVNGLGLVWVGQLWPHAGETESWPPPGHQTHWGGWQPPFWACGEVPARAAFRGV
jgi:hypothetical protein